MANDWPFVVKKKEKYHYDIPLQILRADNEIQTSMVMGIGADTSLGCLIANTLTFYFVV